MEIAKREGEGEVELNTCTTSFVGVEAINYVQDEHENETCVYLTDTLAKPLTPPSPTTATAPLSAATRNWER